MDPLVNQIKELIRDGEKINISERHPADPDGFFPEYVGGPEFDAWMAKIHILNERHLKFYPLYKDIDNVYSSHKKKWGETCDEMLSLLRAVVGDTDFFEGRSVKIEGCDKKRQAVSNRIFIVHGHDDAAKNEVARTLEKVDLEAIILHEQASGGRTIIEKIEEYTDVAFGIVLYTDCDLGRAKESPVEEEKSRARQNVVFEHGYLIGKLGRSNVCALVKGDIETPGDISGVIYIPFDSGGAWKLSLVKEMHTAGLDVDANKLLR